MQHIPGILMRHDPAGDAIPLVLDSPHSGRDYPPDFHPLPPLATLRRSEDMYVGELYAAAPALGATLIEACFPRCFIDPNRSLEDIDVALLVDGWPHPIRPGGKVALGKGLVWRVAKTGIPMYDRKLSAAEIEERIERCYVPYHAALDAATDALYTRFGAVWHIDCHSASSVGDKNAEDAGKTRPDFLIGDRDGTTCAPAFTRLVAEALGAMGYTCSINDPYKGVELVRRHGRPAEGRHSLQIEVNRRLYMNEETFEKTTNFDRLKGDLTKLLETVAAFVRSEARA